MRKIRYCLITGFICLESFMHPVFSVNIYDKYFPNSHIAGSSEYRDTLVERIIWHKKVSNVIFETRKDRYWVTLLVHPESPNNFKSNAYTLYYEYEFYEEAFKKFIWLDNFIKNKGILKVKITGSKIITETILKE